MVYTDGIHVVADTLQELHNMMENIGVKKYWFEGVRKGHPHYDLPKGKFKILVQMEDVMVVRPREILAKSKLMK